MVSKLIIKYLLFLKRLTQDGQRYNVPLKFYAWDFGSSLSGRTYVFVLLSCTRSVCKTSNLLPRGTQISYSAAVDLVAELGGITGGISALVSICVLVYGVLYKLTTSPPEREVESRIESKTEDKPISQNHLLDGFPVDTEAEVVEGTIQIFSQPARLALSMGVSKITKVKYPDCDIYVNSMILFGDLIALPFEGYDMTLGMDGCLNITLKLTLDGQRFNRPRTFYAWDFGSSLFRRTYVFVLLPCTQAICKCRKARKYATQLQLT
ncbi:hypothetical protein M9H77_23086 [Catharanthus roseus]|uniref:Uncharacterized protein n=1 Tax=Catharanthus roseus TaxID=4058 RepID=A0ACC0AS14_CATRO|nr:hypothetical protein M9H77_23086 [Catharanthus roseus]